MRSLFLIALAIAFTSTASAAQLVIDTNGNLTGAIGVQVNGSYYDVTFDDGTCVGLYSGCDQQIDLVFHSEEDAIAASAALSNQVFVDTAAGLFGTDPELTEGCEYLRNCDVLTPYFIDADYVDPYGQHYAVLDAVALTNNWGTLGYNTIWDFRSGYGSPIGLSYDTSDSSYRTYAVWSASIVPIPAAAWLFGSALAGLGWARRRQRVAP